MKLLSTLCWVAGHVFKKKGRSKNFRAILTIPSHLHGTNNSQNIPNTQLYYTFLKFNINCQPLPRIGGFFHDHQSSRNRPSPWKVPKTPPYAGVVSAKRPTRNHPSFWRNDGSRRMLSGWWFQIFFIFIPTWGNDPIWWAYFSKGLKPPTTCFSLCFFGSEKKTVGLKSSLPQKETKADFFKFPTPKDLRWIRIEPEEIENSWSIPKISDSKGLTHAIPPKKNLSVP